MAAKKGGHIPLAILEKRLKKLQSVVDSRRNSGSKGGKKKK